MEVPQAMPVWQAAVSGLLGLVYAFAGYRALRFTARLSSALLFTGLGTLFVAQVPNPWVVAGVMLGSGLVGYLLGNALYFLTVALYGAAAGVVLAVVGSSVVGTPLAWPGAATGAALGGVLAVVFQRPLAIFATAVTGAGLAAAALPAFIGPSTGRFAWAQLLLFAALTVAGCLVQAKTPKDLPQGKAPAKPS